MRFILLTLPASLLVACSTPGTLPQGTVLSGSSGKRTVAVDVSGKTWQQALRQIGLTVAQVGVSIAAQYVTQQVNARLVIPSGK